MSGEPVPAIPRFDKLLVLLQHGWSPLPDKPDENPESTLQALWDTARPDEAGFERLVDQRISGVPLSHLTGKQSFMGLSLLTGPDALIPRKETEIVCQGALEVLREMAQARGSVRVIDVCCGGGNIALALAWHETACTVFGSDISEPAIGLAIRNAQNLGLDGRVQFSTGDLFAPFNSSEFIGNCDLIVCNPPYISTAKLDKMPHEIKDFEPRLAFDGGPFGVKILTRLIHESTKYLKPSSWLAFEVGLGQGKSILKMIGNTPAFCSTETLNDQSGETRAVLARTAPANV